ncbi:hypothetical protein MTR_1g095120 [Medicago truncatula]|uniref:Uncharacterized protein n=1 Tax=Medicago truncatula TaxID=3880 RepID=G7I3A0_MEDTR|nr:hypothetical protein MTR_1g095120 [Medicago truncatula]
MTLSMIHQVPINQRYCYPFTDNVRMATKHLSPHLEIIVVSGLRVHPAILSGGHVVGNFSPYDHEALLSHQEWIVEPLLVTK